MVEIQVKFNKLDLRPLCHISGNLLIRFVRYPADRQTNKLPGAKIAALLAEVISGIMSKAWVSVQWKLGYGERLLPVSQLQHQLTEWLFPPERWELNCGREHMRHTFVVIIINSARLLISSARLFICQKTHTRPQKSVYQSSIQSVSQWYIGNIVQRHWKCAEVFTECTGVHTVLQGRC